MEHTNLIFAADSIVIPSTALSLFIIPGLTNTMVGTSTLSNLKDNKLRISSSTQGEAS